MLSSKTASFRMYYYGNNAVAKSSDVSFLSGSVVDHCVVFPNRSLLISLVLQWSLGYVGRQRHQPVSYKSSMRTVLGEDAAEWLAFLLRILEFPTSTSTT
jgi:hypothetical protein